MKPIIFLIALCSGVVAADRPLNFQDFNEQFSLTSVTTENHHPVTGNLSQTFERDKIAAFKLLQQVDEGVTAGFDQFKDDYLNALSQDIRNRLQAGGRLFLVGSGSSGRIAVDLAAKWRRSQSNGQVIGLIAGGPRAIVKAKEGFEDSIDAGQAALDRFNPTKKDVIILISASGSAKFNIGFGQRAARANAAIYYFHNSTNVPARTQKLFDEYGVKKLLVDIGPQAISGSTRLQAATLAELCLGATLIDVIQEKGREQVDLKAAVVSINQGIKRVLPEISNVVLAGVSAFSDKESNFRKLKDVGNTAYVTVLGNESSIREVLVDATETAPTFSTNPPRAKNEDFKKKAEFRAYMIGKYGNLDAWKVLTGGAKLTEADRAEVNEICLAEHDQGFGSLHDRPTGPGNVVMVATKGKPSGSVIEALRHYKKQGAYTALIYVSSNPNPQTTFDGIDTVIPVVIANDDALGVTSTIALKQTLNLISNGMMLGMQKVVGNRMIDLRLSNQKLIGRGIRIIKDLARKAEIDMTQYPDEVLYRMLIKANDFKVEREANEGTYVPSPVKVVFAQIANEQSMEESIAFLYEGGENINQFFRG